MPVYVRPPICRSSYMPCPFKLLQSVCSCVLLYLLICPSVCPGPFPTICPPAYLRLPVLISSYRRTVSKSNTFLIYLQFRRPLVRLSALPACLCPSAYSEAFVRAMHVRQFVLVRYFIQSFVCQSVCPVLFRTVRSFVHMSTLIALKLVNPTLTKSLCNFATLICLCATLAESEALITLESSRDRSLLVLRGGGCSAFCFSSSPFFSSLAIIAAALPFGTVGGDTFLGGGNSGGLSCSSVSGCERRKPKAEASASP